jgi:hypothetical protein
MAASGPDVANRGSIYNASIVSEGVHDSAEELRKELLQQEREADRLENVRACCDGETAIPPSPTFTLGVLTLCDRKARRIDLIK